MFTSNIFIPYYLILFILLNCSHSCNIKYLLEPINMSSKDESDTF